MLKHIYLILISTFILGFISGVVLFLYNNTGVEGGGTLKRDTAGTNIAVYMYGGCERGDHCSSYRITNTSKYTYIVRGGGDEKRYEGSLSDKQQDVLTREIASLDIEKILVTSFEGTCPSEHDGIAFRYDIERDGTSYSFDSCVQNISGPLFDTLETYFTFFRTAHK